METMETMETSVVPQGHPAWETGTLPGGQVIPPHPTSLHPYGHDDLLPKNLCTSRDNGGRSAAQVQLRLSGLLDWRL